MSVSWGGNADFLNGSCLYHTEHQRKLSTRDDLILTPWLSAPRVILIFCGYRQFRTFFIVCLIRTLCRFYLSISASIRHLPLIRVLSWLSNFGHHLPMMHQPLLYSLLLVSNVCVQKHPTSPYSTLAIRHFIWVSSEVKWGLLCSTLHVSHNAFWKVACNRCSVTNQYLPSYFAVTHQKLALFIKTVNH